MLRMERLPSARRTSRLLWRAAAILTLAVAAVWLETRFDLGARLFPARIEERLETTGAFAPLFFVLIMAVAVIAPLPTFPLDVLAGRLFGPLPGTLYAVTGATLGAAASFALARVLGRKLVARFHSGHIAFWAPGRPPPGSTREAARAG